MTTMCAAISAFDMPRAISWSTLRGFSAVLIHPPSTRGMH
jgi:hypothetical protein